MLRVRAANSTHGRRLEADEQKRLGQSAEALYHRRSSVVSVNVPRSSASRPVWSDPSALSSTAGGWGRCRWR
jgi:hypothetical protein